MAKAAILFSVLVLGWTVAIQLVHTEDEAVAATDAPVHGAHLNQSEICELESATGPCKAFQDRFFYNSTSKACEKFIYGGCGGNLNNFENATQCLSACGEEEPTTASDATEVAQTTEAAGTTEAAQTTEAAGTTAAADVEAAR